MLIRVAGQICQEVSLRSANYMELKNFSQEMRIDRVSSTPVHSNALFEILSECEQNTNFFFPMQVS